jgi:hypothetical protein
MVWLMRKRRCDGVMRGEVETVQSRAAVGRRHLSYLALALSPDSQCREADADDPTLVKKPRLPAYQKRAECVEPWLRRAYPEIVCFMPPMIPKGRGTFGP